MSTITSVQTRDVRFPTSRMLDGSDAMNPDPDYSAAYVVLRTDAADSLEGHGFAFTIGRGNEVQVAAIAALAPLLVGSDVEALLATPPCAGSGPRRASCTWRSAPWSTLSGT
jgi:L-fuconate dehydratase